MARARLLGAIQRLRVHRIDRASTVMDEEAGEPYAGTVERPPIEVPSQFDWLTAKGRTAGQAGPRLPAQATAVVLTSVARRLGWDPTEGDRLSAVLERDGTETPCALYVLRARTRAKTHHGAETWLVEWGDRQPTREGTEAAP